MRTRTSKLGALLAPNPECGAGIRARLRERNPRPRPTTHVHASANAYTDIASLLHTCFSSRSEFRHLLDDSETRLSFRICSQVVGFSRVSTSAKGDQGIRISIGPSSSEISQYSQSKPELFCRISSVAPASRPLVVTSMLPPLGCRLIDVRSKHATSLIAAKTLRHQQRRSPIHISSAWRVCRFRDKHCLGSICRTLSLMYTSRPGSRLTSHYEVPS